MSLLLAASAATVTTPPIPDGGGVVTPTGMPALIRPWLLTPLATLTVTPSTAAAVFAQGNALQDAATSRPLRERLVKYVLEPGTYPEADLPSARPMTYVTSSTGDPKDVIITSAKDGGGVLHTWGGPMCLEGVTLRTLPPGAGQTLGPKYPLHAGGGGSQTFIRVAFDSTYASSDGGGATVGMDGAPGAHYTFWECHFQNASGWLSNMHGPGGGLTISLVNCTASSPNGKEVGYGGGDTTDVVYLVGDAVTVTVVAPSTLDESGVWPAPIGGLTAAERVAYGV